MQGKLSRDINSSLKDKWATRYFKVGCLNCIKISNQFLAIYSRIARGKLRNKTFILWNWKHFGLQSHFNYLDRPDHSKLDKCLKDVSFHNPNQPVWEMNFYSGPYSGKQPPASYKSDPIFPSYIFQHVLKYNSSCNVQSQQMKWLALWRDAI